MNKKTFIVAVLIMVIDQVSKSIIDIYFNVSDSVVIIKNFFNLTYVHNTGGAFSILENNNIILILVSIIALIILYKFMFSFKKNKRNSLAFAALEAGIISNLADRLFLGYVRDFLDFHILGYNYPIFNIADMAIVMGVILLIIAIIKGEDKLEENSK